MRARPSYDGEVLATLSRGALVSVHGVVEGVEGEAGGSRTWLKIQLPAEVAVWVYAPLVDAKSRQVKGKSLKYRAGPGRNYSELGELNQGEIVTEIRPADDWLQIETPAGAIAYVAANLVEPADSRALTAAEAPPTKASAAIPAIRLQPSFQGNPAPLPTAEPPAPVPVESVAAVVPPVQPQVATPIVESSPPVVIESSPASIPPPTVVPVSTSDPREVVREGVIRRTTRLQAPGRFELRSARRTGGFLNRDEGLLDFLIVEDPELKLEPYEGVRVFVHGTEWRDERWRTPALRVKKVELTYE